MSPATGLTIIVALIAAIAAISVIYIIIGPPINTTTTITITQTTVTTATTITTTVKETTKTEPPPATPTTPITPTDTTKPPPTTTITGTTTVPPTTTTITETTTRPPPTTTTPPPSRCAVLNIENISYDGPVAVVQARLIKDGCDGRLSASAIGATVVDPPTSYYDIDPGFVNAVYEFRLVDSDGDGIGAVGFVYISPRTASVGYECPTCQVQNGTRIKFPACKPEFWLKDTNATNIGGAYLVLPGRNYYITVGVGGNIPASPLYPYAVQLSIGGPGAPFVSVLPPNPQFLTSPVPPPTSLTYYISVSGAASAPTSFVPIVYGRFLNLTFCNATAKLAEFVIARPCMEFSAAIEYTNATATSSAYAMVVGQSYLFRIRVRISYPYATMNVRFSVPGADVTPIGYSITPPPPTGYSAAPSSGPGWGGYTFPPLHDRAVLDAAMDFIVRPHTSGFYPMEVSLTSPDSPTCRGNVTVGRARIGEPQPRQCSVWVNVPSNAVVWVTGGSGSLLATINVLVRSVPSGLAATLSAFAPSPLTVVGVNPSSGTTDFTAQVALIIPMATTSGHYNVVYSVSASGQGYQCAARNITSIEVRRCFWNVRILNSTPLVLEVGRTYKLAVEVRGGPYPAVLSASASGVFTVSPASMPISSNGTYYFDISATGAGSGAVTVTVRSRDIYEMCFNRTSAEGVAKERAVCKPTLQIVGTNATDLGGGRYMVMPGGLYRFQVQVGGSLPPASYTLRLLPRPEYTFVNPSSGQHTFTPPPPPLFNFDIQISSTVPPGSTFPLTFQLVGQSQGAVVCATNMTAVLEVGKPQCPRVKYDTNATYINGTYLMEPGKTYRFTVFLSAPWAYQPIYVTLRASNAGVSPGPYSTSPSVPVTSSSGAGFATFAVSPPSPAQPLSGQFTFYVTPSADTDRVSIEVLMGGSPTAPPTCRFNETRPVKPLICKPEVALVGGNATVVGPNTILVDPGAPYEIQIQVGGVISYPWARWRWLGSPSLTITPMVQIIPTPIPPPQTLRFTVSASGPGIFSVVGVIEVSLVSRVVVVPYVGSDSDIRVCYKYQLWVNASQWEFAVKAEPVNATAKPGSVAEFKLYVATLSGAPRKVYLYVHSAPSGWSVNISPNSGITPYSAAVSVTVPSSAATGVYPVVIKATSGSVTRFITLYVSIP
jgi:hypothetical protein